MIFFSSNNLEIFNNHTDKYQQIPDPLGASLFSLHEILNQDKHIFIVTEDSNQALKVYESLSSIYPNTLYFPAIELMPFSHGFPSIDILSARIRVLSLLQGNSQTFIIVLNYQSFIKYLPPVQAFENSSCLWENGIKISSEQIAEILEKYGYSRTSIVREIGEFAIKNQLIDFFPSQMEEPCRIILDSSSIVRINSFDHHSQLSGKKLDKINIYPQAEFLFPKDKEGFQDPFLNPIAHTNFVDYYNSLSLIVDYTRKKHDVIFCSPKELFENKIQSIFIRLHAEKLISLSSEATIKKASRVFTYSKDADLCPGLRSAGNFSGGFTGFVLELEKLIQENESLCACFFSEYPENAKRIAIMLRRFKPLIVNDLNNISENAEGLFIINKSWEFGFFAKAKNSGRSLLFIGETDISEKRKLFRKHLKQSSYSNFESDIEPGDYVVHLNYGIGIFKGIERISSLNKEKDYILIEYADTQKLFVPLEQADLIGRYIGGSEQKRVKVDSLNGKSWQKKKIKAKEDIALFAKHLVDLHAQRLTLEGITFPKDSEEQKAFEDCFKYVETPDQIRAMEEIKSDMENSQPMDHLLCGDVGFGKTEIALRAAFKAIYSGKQAAFLAPTTILSEQHYLTCLERFKNFPIKIALITRFTDSDEKRELFKKIALQEIDLVIGTHAILNKDLNFKDLGLIVIDEEHKFGVTQKEKIKDKYPLIDILSLSATPIPRTLSLALGNMKSISTIETPPEFRIPVETVISDFREDIIQEAIRHELARGGQIYFIQNKIKELSKYADLISELVPEASVIIAHGQMEEDELENAFLGFMRGYYNILLSTTIVESGLDIPNANTLIVSDAHRMGLSQLYQLKGRVGRSNKKAFAYFLFPEHKNITESATKRLDTLSEYTELGAGFQIAKKDLEIRGAGNILGSEQHGHLIAIGFDLYLRLLKDAVSKIKGEKNEEIETLIDLNFNAFIPDFYIKNTTMKMEIYKKIVSLKNEEEIAFLKKELSNRYGDIPEDTLSLFEISKLKIESNLLGIKSITEKKESIEIIFSTNSKIDPFKIIDIAQTGKYPISFSPTKPNHLIFNSQNQNPKIKLRNLRTFLRDIQ